MSFKLFTLLHPIPNDYNNFLICGLPIEKNLEALFTVISYVFKNKYAIYNDFSSLSLENGGALVDFALYFKRYLSS